MTDLHQILQDVAEGRLSPDAAADLLDEPTAPQTSSSPSAPAAASTSAGTSASTGPDSAAGIERLALRISARGVRLIADPSIATVHVEGGPHRVRQEGSTLRVEADTMPPAGGEGDGYSLTDNPSQWRRWLNRRGVANNIVVRANPHLPLEAAVDAGALEVQGWRAPISFTVNAGAVKATDCEGLVDGTVRAGSAKLQMVIPVGESRLHAEAGSIELRLLPGSDVTVHAQAELGSIAIAHSLGGAKVAGSGKAEAVSGSGAGSLDLSVTMGSARVLGA